jgi:hypothetical protein
MKWLPEDYFVPIFSVRRYTRYTNKRSKDLFVKLFLDQEGIEEPPEWGLPHPNQDAAYKSLSKYSKDVLPMTDEEVMDYNLAWEWTEKAYYPYMGNSRIVSLEEAKADLDLNTSCGYPFNIFYKSKKELFAGDDQFMEFMKFDWDVSMLRPDYWFLWVNSLKEEIRPEEKTRENKIRTFTSSALDGTLQGKRLFDDMNRKMNDSHLKTASAIGMSPYSGNWHRLVQKLSVFPNGYALDESEYDSSLRAFMMWGCARLRWRMYREEDQTPENLLRLKNYYRNLVNSLIISPEGVVVMKLGGNPSGSVNTINDNTLILDTLMAYAWIRSQRKIGRNSDITEFHLNTARALVGDDNTWSVSDYAHPFYNARSVIETWKTLGITTTTDSLDARHPRDLDFLSAKSLNYHGLYIPIYDRKKLLTSLLYSNTGKQTPAFTLLRAGAMLQVGWSDVQFRRFSRELIQWLLETYDDVLCEDKDWIQAKTCIHTDPFLERLFCGERLYAQCCDVRSIGKTSQPDKMESKRSNFRRDRRGPVSSQATRQGSKVVSIPHQPGNVFPVGTKFYPNGEVAFIPRKKTPEDLRRERALSLKSKTNHMLERRKKRGPRKENRPRKRARRNREMQRGVRKAQKKQMQGRRNRTRRNKRDRKVAASEGEFGRGANENGGTSDWLGDVIHAGSELLPHLLEFGMGDYEEGEAPMKEGELPTSNSLLAVASEGDAGYAVPMMHSSGTSTRVVHREYLGDVYSSTEAFVTLSFPVNPGMEETFPWLAPVANQYTSYQFMGLNFEFVSQGSDYANAAGLGYVAYASQYNVAAPAFLDKREMLNYQFADACKPSKNMSHWVECQPSEVPLPEKFTRAGTPPVGTDLRFYDHATFTLAVGGNTASGSVIGQLWATYDVKLIFPKISGSAAGVLNYYNVQRSGVTLDNPLGTTTVINNPRNTMAMGINPLQLLFPVNIRGDYRVFLNYAGPAGGGTTVPNAWSITPSGSGSLFGNLTPSVVATATTYWQEIGVTVLGNGCTLSTPVGTYTGLPTNTVNITITQIPRAPPESPIFDKKGLHADEKQKAIIDAYVRKNENRVNSLKALVPHADDDDDEEEWECLRKTSKWDIEIETSGLNEIEVYSVESGERVAFSNQASSWKQRIMDAHAKEVDEIVEEMRKASL